MEPNRYSTERANRLADLLTRRILVLDGATGTALAGMGLTAAHYGGESLLGCHEALVLHHPEAVRNLHRLYLDAGANLVETDTFGATPVVLAEYGLQGHTLEINRRAAALAREACAEAEAKNPSRPRFVAGSIGPTTKSLTLTGGISFDELREGYALQAQGLAEGGADILLIETVQDALNLKAALIGCREAAPGVPVAVSATVEPSGTTLGGQTIEAIATLVEPYEPLWIGLNCATGPRAMAEHVRALAALTPSFVAVVPNAGLPDSDGRYLEGPAEVAACLARYASSGWVNLVGGCCGTTAGHVTALCEMAKGRTPRVRPAYDPSRLAGGEVREMAQERPPLLIGERTNVLGSRKFKALIQEERWAEAAEVGRRQARTGAQVLDVCLADSERNELEGMTHLLKALRRAVRLPLMVDTTDSQVMESALKLIPGRPILNSVNLEDGGGRLTQVARLARRYGAALVAGCIDDHPTDGMARTAERKLEVARRLLDQLEGEGVRRREVLLDPLVFPAATGDPKFQGSAKETVEGVRRIKAELPGALTVLGISNVSFGLPAAGREVLNAVFLHHCVEAGLDAAIVNTEQLVRFPSLGKDEIALAEAVLFEGGREAVDAFVAHYRTAVRLKAVDETLPAEERVRRMVVAGERSGLETALDELLARHEALAIINGPLLQGMDEVGRLFGAGQLIVAEVLVSAEVMQAAVNHLRPHLHGESANHRGSILLATVRGDVHDIGKNLVGMIFSTNGYRVVDLGVQVSSERILEAWRQHRTDLIGLSGLLVRSAHQMVATAEDLASQGIQAPILVGGAALSGSFTASRIAPVYPGLVEYAPDAMAGLASANRILQGEVQRPAPGAPAVTLVSEPPLPPPEPLAPLEPSDLPMAPWLGRRVMPTLDLETLFTYLNPQMLLGKHLGLKGPVAKLLKQGDAKTVELAERVEALKDAAVAREWLKPAAVFGFFKAHSTDQGVVVTDPEGNPLAELPYPRMKRPPRRSAADWVHPDPNAGDTVALFCLTAGPGVAERAATLRDKGEFLESFALQALALETAEAGAEWMHQKIRGLWGFPDDGKVSLQDLFQTRYRGIRLSFGYPACPDLEPQAELFRLLQPEEIGVRLTEEYMMAPEASVSAVVFHHPEAKYLA